MIPHFTLPLSHFQAIQKGNMEGAKIHAENAIRQKNQALNYRRMSARIDAVASRVQTAVTTRQVTNSMAGVVKSMESAMKSMNLEKVRLLRYISNYCHSIFDRSDLKSLTLWLNHYYFS